MGFPYTFNFALDTLSSIVREVQVQGIGGAVVGGFATVCRGTSVKSVGGIVTGGTAQISYSSGGIHTTVVSSTGGAVSGGTASISRGVQIWGSGGFIAAGTAIVSCNSIAPSKSTIVIKLWDGSYTQLKLAA